MAMGRRIPGWKDKALFTAGPLTTSRTVKQVMLRDVAPRDAEFIAAVRSIRERLLVLAGVRSGDYEAVLMQGSGIFAVESVFSSCVPPDGKVLVIVNGAHGHRMVKICQALKIETEVLAFPEDALPDTKEIERTLNHMEGLITHVAVVHCETTTGIINPVQKIGRLAKAADARYIVDAMSSLGAVPLNVSASGIDYLISSGNKCIEGVPGFGFVIARREALMETGGYARSLSLNLLDQWKSFEETGQFRFTPPTHVLLAFHQALLELEAEGGVEGRAARYYKNNQTLVTGMRALGFQEFLKPELQGYIITSFRCPEDPRWSFEEFYKRLNDRDYVIYPARVSKADCFRIGNIGRVHEADIKGLLAAVREVVEEMGLELNG